MKRLLLALLAAMGCSGPASPELTILIWADYIPDATIREFEKEANCRVKVDYLTGTEMLRAKLERRPSGYDVVQPSDEILPPLIAAGALDPLDHAKLPNLKNIAARFRGLEYDPSNAHSVPFMWGTTGIAYHKKHVDPAPDSWEALWDPKVADRMTMLEDQREVFAAAMRLDGTDPAAPTEEAIAKARRRLSRKPRAWTSQPKDMLIQGDAVISQSFSGDALQAADALEGQIGYVIPKEGGTLWIDNLSIAKGSRQADLAHRFIDFLLRPEVSAHITNEMKFPNPNEAAAKHIKKEILENPLIYPPEEVLRRCRLLKGLSPDAKKRLNDAWAEVKGQ